jgi:hypothetical protein
MFPVVELTGTDLTLALTILGVPEREQYKITSLRVAVDGGFKMSVNRHMWTSALGEVQP